MFVRRALAVDFFFKQYLVNHWSKFKIISHECSHHALYHYCINGSAPLITRAARALDKKSFRRHLIPKLNRRDSRALDKKYMVQIINITELFVMMAATIIAEMVLLGQIKGPPELKIRNVFKCHLLNHRTKFKIISQNCSS